MVLVCICSALFCLYALLMLIYSTGWQRLGNIQLPQNYKPFTKISVVIAARNEAENIPKTINAVLAQNYPLHLFELIIVDDFSTDNTAEIVADFSVPNIKLIRLSDFVNTEERIVSFKKKALKVGIENSSGTLIVSTDADCWMGENWLLSIASFYEENQPEMIVAPVQYSCKNSVLELFQTLDFTTMQGITAATVRLDLGVMCNGANLAFSRKAFDAVNGYEGVEHLVSGDDYLLQLKIKNQFPKGVKYLKSKEAIVATFPQKTWQNFLQQRIRWASKTGKYSDPKMTFILSLIYIFNCGLLVLGVFCFFESDCVIPFITLILGKIFIELFFLIPIAHFFQQKKLLFIFPFLQPVHIAYIVLAGFLSRVSTFVWKERVNTASNQKK